MYFQPILRARHLAKWLCALLMVLAAQALPAQELFENLALKPIAPGAPVNPDATIGGYPIYQGDKNWQFVRGSVQGPNNFDVSYGSVELSNPDGMNFLALMGVSANLNQTSRGFYMTSDPCSGSHLVRVSKVKPLGSEGAADDCLTIDPLVVPVSGRALTVLDVRVTHTQSASRYYRMRILLNPIVLGLGETVPADWTVEDLQRNPDRLRVMQKVSAWAGQLQLGVQDAIGFGKPKDAFKNVPSLRDLQMTAGASK